MVEHMLAVNADIQMLVADVVMTVNVGDVAVAEENRYLKLKLISETMSMGDMDAEDMMRIMALSLEEEHIDS